jgi:hypothetical protein
MRKRLGGHLPLTDAIGEHYLTRPGMTPRRTRGAGPADAPGRDSGQVQVAGNVPVKVRNEGQVALAAQRVRPRAGDVGGTPRAVTPPDSNRPAAG